MNELKIFENEQFGKIRTVEIDGTPYFVGKDEAYQALSEALDNPCVLNAISKALSEQFYNKNKANPYEEWVQTFLTASVKAKRWEV